MFARILAVAALVAALVVVPVGVQSASASVVSPGNPSPINLLPSTVKGSMTGTSFDVGAALMYKLVQSPDFWNIVQKKNTAPTTVTVTEAQVLSDGLKKFAVPMTKIQPLLKTVGGVTTAFTGYSMGAQFTAGAMSLVGIDANGTVCSNRGEGFAGELLAMFAGQDCGAFDAVNGFTPNQGVSALNSGTHCTANGANCITYKGTGMKGTSQYLVFTVSGSNPNLNSLATDVYVVWQDGITAYSSLRSGSFYCGEGIGADGCAYDSRPSSTVKCFSIAYISGGCATNGNSGGAAVTTGTANPTRTLRCVVVGTNGTTYTGEGSSFTETSAVFKPPVCPTLPPGVDAQTVKIDETGEASPHTLYERSTTPEYQTHQTLYPGCDAGTCILTLEKAGESCFLRLGLCEGWFTSPTKTNDYTCKYGTYTVQLSECTTYAPTFEPSARATGNTLGDPDTGTPMTNPTPGATNTQTGASSAPVAGPDSTRQCMPEGWGVFNPIEWVMRPVGCALEWAFVPRASSVSDIQGQIQDAAGETVFGQVQSLGEGFGAAFASLGNGCQGPPWNVNMTLPGGSWVGTEYPLSACSAPMSTFAQITYGFSSFIVVILGAFAVVRYLAALIGYVGAGQVRPNGPRFRDEGD